MLVQAQISISITHMMAYSWLIRKRLQYSLQNIVAHRKIPYEIDTPVSLERDVAQFLL